MVAELAAVLRFVDESDSLGEALYLFRACELAGFSEGLFDGLFRKLGVFDAHMSCCSSGSQWKNGHLLPGSLHQGHRTNSRCTFGPSFLVRMVSTSRLQ